MELIFPDLFCIKCYIYWGSFNKGHILILYDSSNTIPCFYFDPDFGQINPEEFDDLCHAIALKFSKEDCVSFCTSMAKILCFRFLYDHWDTHSYGHISYCHLLQPSCFESIPSIYYCSFSEKLKTFIRSDTFRNIIAFILVINLIAVIIETTVKISFWSLKQV